MKYRKCRRCKAHLLQFHDEVCNECREEEYQFNLGE